MLKVITNNVRRITSINKKYFSSNFLSIYNSNKSNTLVTPKYNVLKQTSRESSNLLLIETSSNDNFTNISLVPPSAPSNTSIKRVPSNICCIIDISGSMSANATMISNTSTGVNEEYGLSLLDIVKHAVKTIIYSLTQDDKFSLIVFNREATLVVDMSKMDDIGRLSSLVELDKFNAEGSTNICSGLEMAYTVIKKNIKDNNNTSIFLLTDGESNISPPKGDLNWLSSYIEKNNLQVPVNTFGFGYNSNSSLLCDISHNSTGIYSFIPDSSFVGTVFVNSLSSFLVNFATNVTAKITTNNSNNSSNSSNSTSNILNLGSIMYGQSRDIVVSNDFIKNNNVELSLTYTAFDSSNSSNSSSFVNISQPSKKLLINKNISNSDLTNLTNNYYRMKIGYIISNNIDNDRQLTNQLNLLVDEMYALNSNTNTNTSTFFKDLIKDISGQILLASSNRSNWEKWGQRYLRSIAMAHMTQICTNFKDPGIQHYGGKLFRELRDKIDEIFCRLPPPKSSVRSGVSVSNMRTFNNSNNPCFAGQCEVMMVDNSTKLVKDIVIGDVVKAPNRRCARVKYIVKSIVELPIKMIKFNSGLIITPWHPIRVLNGIKEEWQFPKLVNAKLPELLSNKEVVYSEEECPAVYSFVLENDHIMIINNIQCITLGNNFSKGGPEYHPYFSSNKVIDDLKILDDEQKNNGLVEINSDFIVRDRDSYIIKAIKSNVGWFS